MLKGHTLQKITKHKQTIKIISDYNETHY